MNLNIINRYKMYGMLEYKWCGFIKIKGDILCKKFYKILYIQYCQQ